ncbi:CBS domain-containing protein [Dactylosporangium sp. CA-092794]|uniref:CBS domain-containing protein n=1 Tax=Dactylosporangium sp. CA-092794 TaxID=3239929 RepID=UPI003D91D8F1
MRTDSGLAHRSDLRDVLVTMVMSHPVQAVAATALFDEALTMLITRRLRHLAVVEPTGKCVGLLTDRTVAAEWVSHPTAFLDRTVGATCDAVPPLVNQDATVATAARVMRHCGTDAVIVVDPHRRPLGVLTSNDVIAILAKPDLSDSRRG